MPLAFPSLRHGTIAFGFFNIACDMLLLENLFFFAHDFCRAAEEVAQDQARQVDMGGWRIDDRGAVGNLHGAIAGRDHGGFLGATYRAFPFPDHPAGFKQWPDGHRNRDAFRALIEPFSRPERLAVAWNPDRGEMTVESFAFDRRTFRRLVAYVEQGGYPRWRDEERPRYVLAAARAWGTAPPRPEG